jgi:hypothetical protein
MPMIITHIQRPLRIPLPLANTRIHMHKLPQKAPRKLPLLCIPPQPRIRIAPIHFHQELTQRLFLTALRVRKAHDGFRRQRVRLAGANVSEQFVETHEAHGVDVLDPREHVQLGLGQVVEVQCVEEVRGDGAVFFLDVFGVVAEYEACGKERWGHISCLGESFELKLDLCVGRVAGEPGNAMSVVRGSCLTRHTSLAGCWRHCSGCEGPTKLDGCEWETEVLVIVVSVLKRNGTFLLPVSVASRRLKK